MNRREVVFGAAAASLAATLTGVPAQAWERRPGWRYAAPDEIARLRMILVHRIMDPPWLLNDDGTATPMSTKADEDMLALLGPIE